MNETSEAQETEGLTHRLTVQTPASISSPGTALVLYLSSRSSVTPSVSAQAPHQPSGSGGVGAGPVVVPDGVGEEAQPPPGGSSSSRSRPDLPRKAK